MKTFVIYCDDKELATLPTAPVCNSRPVFQGVMYSDTPDYSMPKMEYKIEGYDASRAYSIAAVNTSDLQSEKTAAQAK